MHEKLVRQAVCEILKISSKHEINGKHCMKLEAVMKKKKVGLGKLVTDFCTIP